MPDDFKLVNDPPKRETWRPEAEKHTQDVLFRDLNWEPDQLALFDISQTETDDAN